MKTTPLLLMFTLVITMQIASAQNSSFKMKLIGHIKDQGNADGLDILYYSQMEENYILVRQYGGKPLEIQVYKSDFLSSTDIELELKADGEKFWWKYVTTINGKLIVIARLATYTDDSASVYAFILNMKTNKTTKKHLFTVGHDKSYPANIIVAESEDKSFLGVLASPGQPSKEDEKAFLFLYDDEINQLFKQEIEASKTEGTYLYKVFLSNNGESFIIARNYTEYGSDFEVDPTDYGQTLLAYPEMVKLFLPQNNRR